MHRRLRRGLCLLSFVAFATPAHADPMLMFLFSVARELVTQASARAATRPAPVDPMAEPYAGTVVTPAQLRRVIDECFGYLSDRQRAEVFAALHAGLADARNAAVRGAMIEFFMQRAVQARAAQEYLGRLTPREMRRIATEFRRDAVDLPEHDRTVLETVLRQRLLPVPQDLNDMLLAALDAPRP